MDQGSRSNPKLATSSLIAPETTPEEVHGTSSTAHQTAPGPVGVSRKQNVACDACRTKKVRCLRQAVTEKVCCTLGSPLRRTLTKRTQCAQCVAKGAECTSEYIEKLQRRGKKRRKSQEDGDGDTGRKRRRKSNSAEDDDDSPGPSRRRSGSAGVEKQPSSSSQPWIYWNGETSHGVSAGGTATVGNDDIEQ